MPCNEHQQCHDHMKIFKIFFYYSIKNSIKYRIVKNILRIFSLAEVIDKIKTLPQWR